MSIRRTLTGLIVAAQAITPGCYRYTRGDMTGVRRISGTETVLNERQTIEVQRRPTPGVPIITFRLFGFADVEYTVEAVHQVVKVERQPVKLLGSLLLIAGGAAGIVAARGMTDGDTLTNGGQALTAAGALSGLFGLIGILDALEPDAPEVVNGRTLPGALNKARETVPRGPLRNRTVTVTAPDHQRDYLSTESGEVSVNLLEDFGWRYFDDLPTVRVSAAIPGTDAAAEASLRADEWLVPCVRATGRGTVHQRPTVGSPRLGEFSPSAVFALRDETSVDWYGIDYRGAIGWIPRVAGRRCWQAAGGG